MLKIPCTECKGKGVVPIPTVLEEVLKAIRAGYHTAPRIYQHVSDRGVIDVTAINQRLRRLMALGLVAKKPQRGSRNTNIYSVKPQQKKKST